MSSGKVAHVTDFVTELDALQGFEPRSSDSESDILPLDDRAVRSNLSIMALSYHTQYLLSSGSESIIEF
ncbi:uncharacterized protein METZ01_LOCUS92719 [marine metagenome]|uniref:Uncharacterized protein n=1 Tax=marine metagenome TaxID=408172 RepID=A0A381VHN7_9ZZZZ